MQFPLNPKKKKKSNWVWWYIPAVLAKEGEFQVQGQPRKRVSLRPCLKKKKNKILKA
jgi:cytochrome c-type biogenesis protein CcmH/NrfF